MLVFRYTKKLCVDLTSGTLEEYSQFLPYLPSLPLFPNLESTTLQISQIPDPPNPELMALLLPPTLSEANIVRRDWGRLADSFVARVLQILSEEIKPRKLRSLSLGRLTNLDLPSTQHISQLLRSQPALQVVDICAGSGLEILEMLHSTGRLIHLRHLTLHAVQIDTHFERAPHLLFPALETLEIGGSAFFVHGVLDCVGIEKMRSVELLVDELQGGTDAEYSTLLTKCLVSIGRFIHLKKLDLETEMRGSFKLLDHVQTCKELETLRWVGSDLDPSETEESRHKKMTLVWPRLKTLELQSLITSPA
ncbi:hypothetical protein FRC00_005734 [Tulasnella sp. 408]|nr:hypothetical protein FRC00_005734 [Tulasnella sp. 408]